MRDRTPELSPGIAPELIQRSTENGGKSTRFPSAASGSLPGTQRLLSNPTPGTTYREKLEEGNSPTHQLDLLPQIGGLFRLLDLHSEFGSGGPVDKIVIDQDALSSLIDTISPKAYHSLTRIDFANLDKQYLKVIGIYGSKSEIVRFLQSLSLVDGRLARLLLRSSQARQEFAPPTLRSGLYLLFAPTGAPRSDPAQEAYIIYWPEDTTWDDKAIAIIRKNRVTFMRYLFRLTDQVMALISPEHGRKLLWKAPYPEEMKNLGAFGADDDIAVEGSDHLFEFEVVVTKDQEEGVFASLGFTLEDEQISSPSLSRAAPDLEPELVISESRQAFIRKCAPRTYTQYFDERFPPIGLKSFLTAHDSIYIDVSVTQEGVMVLMEEGNLQSRVQPRHQEWLAEKAKILQDIDGNSSSLLDKAKEEFLKLKPHLVLAIRAGVAQKFLVLYPFLEVEQLYDAQSSALRLSFQDALRVFQNLLNSPPGLKSVIERCLKDAELHKITSAKYQRVKEQLLAAHTLAEVHPSFQTFVPKSPDIFENSDVKQGFNRWSLTPLENDFVLVTPCTDLFRLKSTLASQQAPENEAKDDPNFLQRLSSVAGPGSQLSEVNHALDLATSWAKNKIEETTLLLLCKVEQMQQKADEEKVTKHQQLKRETEVQAAFKKYCSHLQQILCKDRSTALIVTDVTPDKLVHHRLVRIKAHSEVRLDPKVDYTLHCLEFTQEDGQRVREIPSFIPSPRFCAPISFSLLADRRLIQTHLLGSKRCLLIVDSPSGILLYLGDTHTIARGSPTKHLPRAGSNTIFAVDETKRLLALVMQGYHQLSLQLFVFDETFSTIHARGTQLQIAQWYQDPQPQIRRAFFISGTEDLCILEESGRIRIFSFVSQTFRSASLQLPVMPLALFSAPDGSAVVAVEPYTGGARIRVFHTVSFGENAKGILLSDEPLPVNSQCFAISSLENRHNIHVVALCPSTNSLRSVALRLSQRSTDFQYRPKNERESRGEVKDSLHNSLIDCLAEVWTRYPVVPAIKRDPICAETRIPPMICYVVDSDHHYFRPYFKRMVQDFKDSTHKPTERKLDDISVQSFDFDKLVDMMSKGALSISSFKAGEWLVELLCLIPIHIAIAKGNAFSPLNNGIVDPSLEQRLLGAEVPQIVDALNLGWYESIFSSYMAAKPVKVISSMGEQSTGKSYALNHLINSSFAGSTVRTTEGVWLSLCPTRDYLVVALDFEGVHSIERTPQEDMLLVLFSTAISNMVVFRNNSTSSQDFTNMFKSFQASTSLATSNPRLFKGLFVVAIKDVVETDKGEIVKKFRGEFTRIVSEQRETNFITVLHDGQNAIIPWPVIESRKFYTLFSCLKVKLLQQPITHKSAGEFLLTLKTLMAKLKVQDWGALDQNLTKHRVAILSSLLPMAMVSGSSGVDSEPEPLKDLETQSLIPDHADSYEQFCLSTSPSERQSVLNHLLNQWKYEAARFDITELETYIQSLVEKRIAHVRDWVYTNTARFPSENADIRALKSDFENACNTLRLSVQVCRSECTSCHLPCTLSKLHERSAHGCGTSHRCLDDCEFLDAHEARSGGVSCGLPAGHYGRHMCAPAAHCCGAPCELSGKKGCQKSCMKMVDHIDEGHLCSARTHQCGKPCDLQNVQSINGVLHSCLNICTAPHDVDHTRHACNDSQSCPISCELCPRSCAQGDHFHGLDPSSIHLCGQEHFCTQLCAAPGICEITPEPRSTEAIFTGVYETFQYTKYIQETRRLPCAVLIAPGERDHPGVHIHTMAADPFHFCETTCPTCGYFCTLRLGHSQLEHDTLHGSMDKTSWATEGNSNSDAVVEIQGRKYAPQDAGAPHLCNMICSSRGRHAHIDYCRSQDGSLCNIEESSHIDVPMAPNPQKAKDWVSHALFWRRTGFRDPYSKHEQAEFARCDALCADAEHEATTTHPARPSFCKLPIFHPPQPLSRAPPSGQGYISTDGHSFSCTKPTTRQAYHILFVLDKSSSMGSCDRRPLMNTPLSATISKHHNNRFGAVLSALEAFWSSRNNNVGASPARRDAYSVIFFDHHSKVSIANDFTSTPYQLLHALINGVGASGGTDFNSALQLTQMIMVKHWSTDLSPVVVFLSDGECGVDDSRVYDLCNRAIAHGKPLSFHAVSFGGPDAPSLRRMVGICQEVSQNAPRDPLTPAADCSFTDVINTIRLAETFVQIAESLKKPRAALIRS